MLFKIFACLLVARCFCENSSCPDSLDEQPLHMMQRHAAKVPKVAQVPLSRGPAERPRDLHVKEDSEGAFRSACFKFLQFGNAEKAIEVLQIAIEAQNNMRSIKHVVPEFEPSFTAREPIVEAPRYSSADAARIHDTPVRMDWIGPQFDAISSHHSLTPYPVRSSPITSAWELANNMQLNHQCSSSPPLSLMSLSHERSASSAEMHASAHQPKDPRPPEKAGIAGAIRNNKVEQQEPPVSKPSTERDDMWKISSQTTFGTIDLYVYVQMIWGIVICMFICIMMFEAIHVQFLGFDSSLPLPPVPGMVYKRLRNMLWGIVPLSKPYFWGDNRMRAWRYGLMIFGLMFIEAFLDLGSILMLNLWTTAMFSVNYEKIIRIFLVQVVNISAKTFAVAYRNYVQTILNFEWRESLANFIGDRWLKWHLHYFMHLSSKNHFHSIDNPEQRIQEDVRTTVHQMIELGEMILRSVFVLILNVPVLYALVPSNVFGTSLKLPGWPVLLCLLWCFTGGVITHMLFNVLIAINWLRAREEAFYRDRIGHVKRNSEAIAVGNCEPAEGQNIQMQYDKVKFIMWKGGLWQKRLTWWFQLYKDIGGKLAFIVFIPSYLKGDLSFGGFAQASVTLIMITEAVDIFATNYHNYIAPWRAASDRVLQFLHVLEEVEPVGEDASTMVRHGQPMQADVADIVKADFDVITTPSREIIWNKLELAVPKGQKLLISGMEGDGKSTVFRMLCGIWPFFNGGRVTTASWVETILFIPAYVLIPPVCSLRAALAYPEHSHFYDDEEMETVLRAVGLARVLQEEWYQCLPRGEEENKTKQWLAEEDMPTDVEVQALDRVASWYDALSPDMLQRLSFAHALLKKPQLLVIDEPLSSLNKRSCTALFKLLKDYLPQGAAVISITHDTDTFAALHDRHLAIKGFGVDRQLVPTSWLKR